MEARKGDLVLIECRTIISALTEPRRERVTYEFGMVGSATRDGAVKTWHSLGWGDETLARTDTIPPRHERMWVMPRKGIDVMAALEAAKAHHWPEHPGQPMPFDTFEEAREAVRPYVTASVKG